MNTAIVKIGMELREFARVATWIVPLTQWLYFAWILITPTTMEDEANRYLPYGFEEAFVPVGYLLTLLCLLTSVVILTKDCSVKNLVPLVLNALWIGFPVFALMMGWGH